MKDSFKNSLSQLDSSIYQSSMHTYLNLINVIPEKKAKEEILSVLENNIVNLKLKDNTNVKSIVLDFLINIENQWISKAEKAIIEEDMEENAIFLENVLSSITLVKDIIQEEENGT